MSYCKCQTTICSCTADASNPGEIVKDYPLHRPPCQDRAADLQEELERMRHLLGKAIDAIKIPDDHIFSFSQSEWEEACLLSDRYCSPYPKLPSQTNKNRPHFVQDGWIDDIDGPPEQPESD